MNSSNNDSINTYKDVVPKKRIRPKRTCIDLNPDLKRTLKLLATAKDLSLTKCVEKVIIEGLIEEKKRQANSIEKKLSAKSVKLRSIGEKKLYSDLDIKILKEKVVEVTNYVIKERTELQLFENLIENFQDHLVSIHKKKKSDSDIGGFLNSL